MYIYIYIPLAAHEFGLSLFLSLSRARPLSLSSGAGPGCPTLVPSAAPAETTAAVPKVSALVHLLFKITLTRTFQNLSLPRQFFI